MAIKSNINQYRGVNPHLQSRLQTPGTGENPSMWRSFHNRHIAHLADFLDAQLPDGYLAINEQSLQVLGELEGGAPVQQKRIPDVAIYGQPTSGQFGQVVSAVAPTLQTTIAMTVDPADIPDAVAVYQVKGDSELGKLVTCIELLSPSNKPGGASYPDYVQSRIEALRSGTALIEMDYLHETPSPVRGTPVYPHNERSHAYYIAISAPRPNFVEGWVLVFGFDVDQPVPPVNIPLLNDEFLPFDFDAVYQYTYQRGLWRRLVDYALAPARLDTYSEADRERIRARMAAIKAAHESGADLDAGPVETETLSP